LKNTLELSRGIRGGRMKNLKRVLLLTMVMMVAAASLTVFAGEDENVDPKFVDPPQVCAVE